MFDNTPPRQYTLAEKETRELILYVRARKWKYFIIAFLLGCYFFYLFKYKILEYSATATFLINDHSIVASILEMEKYSVNDNYIRIYELINSAATQKHLITKYHLIEHYGIDTTKEFYYERALAKIRSNIQVSKNPFNAISVKVTDRYRYLPAEMANEIVAYIERLNQEYYINNIQKNIEVSQAYVSQIESDNRRKSLGIDSLIQKLNAMIASGKLSERSTYSMLGNQQQLSDLITIFKTSTTELVNSQKLYNLTLQALNFKTFPTITVLQIAMPAFRSIVYKAILFTILSMIGVFFLLVLQGYFYMHYKDYIRLFFTGK